MFGMEKKPESKQAAFLFDLEKDLKDESRRKELAARIESRILKIKELLRRGSKRDDFDKLALLLNGYHALAVVLSRATQEPSRKRA